MRFTSRLQAVKRLFLDTAPVIYFVEKNGRYFALLRAKYNLTLTDTIQLATALTADCDSFLTNDMALKQVAELNVIVLDDTEP